MSVERVYITGCASELQGVGRLENGKSVFVAGALAGETVEAEIEKDAGRYCVAKLTRVIEPSSARQAPICAHYGECGGCQAQHILYAHSLELKRQIVIDALKRIGGQADPPVLPTIGAPEIYGYRNKAEFAISNTGADVRAGVYEKGTRRIIDIDECALQAAPINRAFRAVKEQLGTLKLSGVVIRANAAGEVMLVLCAKDRIPAHAARALAQALAGAHPEIASVYECIMRAPAAHALDGEHMHILGKRALAETLLGIDYQISPRSFFQVNKSQAQAMYEYALKLAHIKSGDEIADVYSGIGALALGAAKMGAQATGIEIVKEAVNDARENARQNHLDHNARFIQGDASQIYTKLSRETKFSAVFTDPPRKGIDAPVLNALIQSPCQNLIYISCNPATLARDLKQLTAQAYTLITAQPIDMFPQTAHIETVCLLSKLHAEHHIEVS